MFYDRVWTVTVYQMFHVEEKQSILTKTSDSEPLVKYIIGINSIIFDRMVSFDKT